jgi:hypothetical protein
MSANSFDARGSAASAISCDKFVTSCTLDAILDASDLSAKLENPKSLDDSALNSKVSSIRGTLFRSPSDARVLNLWQLLIHFVRRGQQVITTQCERCERVK